MKRKTFQILIKIFVFIIIITFIGFLYTNQEPNFKITKEGIEVDRINNFGIPNQSYFYNLSEQDLSIEWLNENCEVEEPVCEYIFDKTKRFEIKDEEAVAKTYEGLIWYEKQKDGSEIVFYCPSNENCFKQICEEPNKYICGEYFVEIK